MKTSWNISPVSTEDLPVEIKIVAGPPLAQIKYLIKEARDTIHACNRQIIVQEARLETRDFLDRALELMDDVVAEIPVDPKPVNE